MTIILTRFASMSIGDRWQWRVQGHTGWIVASGWSLDRVNAQADAEAYAKALIPESYAMWAMPSELPRNERTSSFVAA